MTGRPAIDLNGRVFGQLTVIRQLPINGGRNALWECLCTCQRAVPVASIALRSGKTKSCGCLRAKMLKKNRQSVSKEVAARTDEEQVHRRVWAEYKGSTKKLKRVFELSFQEFSVLLSGACYYCGTLPFSGMAPRSSCRSKVLRNGIDRIDSSRGYVVGNVASCCKHCNKAKLDRSVADFINHCRVIVAHWEGRLV